MDEIINQNLTMYAGQLAMVIRLIKLDRIDKEGLLIQLQGIKAQIEMDIK